MDEESFKELSGLLNKDLIGAEDITNSKPLLAHYTSIDTIEAMLKNSELWLSNPLNMNDHQEVLAGLNFTQDAIHASEELGSCFSKDGQLESFVEAFYSWKNKYGETEGFDLYAACFSKHEERLTDGQLAMWRGYGDFGRGAAIVFDTSKIAPLYDSPLIIAPVQYASDEERKKWCRDKVSILARYFSTKDSLDDDFLSGAAHHFFRRMLLFSLYTKHIGFSEEREWRLVYLKSHDFETQLSGMYSYANGKNGLEPKLKLKLRADTPYFSDDFVLDDIIHSIIVGPRASSPLSRYAVQRMLKEIGKDTLADKVVVSSIPFRG